MIKHEDLEKFRGQYPYGSELFGVYQTLLGWRGARARNWFAKGYAADRSALRGQMFRHVQPQVEARPNADHVLTEIGRIGIGWANADPRFAGTLVQAVAAQLPSDAPFHDPAFWRNALNDDVLTRALDTKVRDKAHQLLKEGDVDADMTAFMASNRKSFNAVQLRSERALQFLEQESRMAGQLRILRDNGAVGELQQTFLHHTTAFNKASQIALTLAVLNPFALLDSQDLLSRAVISPIGIIHLFRQYFFELDSFLGSPVGHVWVAPATTVELVEINSRRTVTEMIIDESAFSRLERFEDSFTLENLHDSVQRTNQQDLSFGASVSGSHSWIVGSAQASSSVNYHQTQSESRLAVHDLMRRQTQRIASLMERSVRTTFKTVTEKSEVSSKRYVVSNPGPDLINYELRRKMRRVAVQVQDAGTYLSWQTFVDDPGRELGVANLVHIAEPPNLANIPHPQMIVPKESKKTTEVAMIPFQPYGHSGCDPAGLDDTSERWATGIETSIGVMDEVESIQWVFPLRVRAPDKDYRLAEVIAKPQGDATVQINAYGRTITAEADEYYGFTLFLEKAHFHDANEIPVLLEYRWESKEDQTKIDAENKAKLATFVAQQKRAYEEAYIKAARERISMASKIASRRYEDLRQEERIAVYRRLVRSLAPGRNPKNGAEIFTHQKFSFPDMSDETRHAWSEILNRLFDLEKMLYFVAPEWWKPKARIGQAMGAEEAELDAAGNVVRDANGNVVMKSVNRTAIPDRDVVGWGGGGDGGRANYYITEDSAPARLGSSLGWLLQLDGDSMRNAFLNAPWVKAVVPIRPGMERDAINWLKDVIEGSDGLDAVLEEQLALLAEKVAAKHETAKTVKEYPDLTDPDSTVAATPVDRVFEYGFDPLQGGFRAESLEGGEFDIIDQWIEVVPTDQVAAVAVKYDPITGRQVPPE